MAFSDGNSAISLVGMVTFLYYANSIGESVVPGMMNSRSDSNTFSYNLVMTP